MSHRMGWIRSCLGLLALWGLSSPALGGQILKDTFNETGFPKNWTQFLGTSGDVKVVSSGHLLMTDSTGKNAGIFSGTSTAPTVFNPVGVTTTDTVHINSVSTSPIGNAIFGLIGLTAGGELAAGIDSTGVVFIVESDPTKNLNQNIVLLGTDTKYKGGATTLTLAIDATGIDVTSSLGFNSGHKSFSTDLNGFTLQGAFGGEATPALVGASQMGQKGGSANFGSVIVNTVVGSAVPEPSGLTSLGIGATVLGVVAAIRRKARVVG